MLLNWHLNLSTPERALSPSCVYYTIGSTLWIFRSFEAGRPRPWEPFGRCIGSKLVTRAHRSTVLCVKFCPLFDSTCGSLPRRTEFIAFSVWPENKGATSRPIVSLGSSIHRARYCTISSQRVFFVVGSKGFNFLDGTQAHVNALIETPPGTKVARRAFQTQIR